MTAPELRELARQIRTCAAEVSQVDAGMAVELNQVARRLVARADRLELPAFACPPDAIDESAGGWERLRGGRHAD
jgi:hypothetical protein